MLKKITEAERIFCCYCDGFIRSLKQPRITNEEELHADAKIYVRNVLKLKKESEDR